MRCFIALRPSFFQTRALTALGDRLRCGRQVAEDDLHLTLAFMEKASQDALEDLNALLDLLKPGPVMLGFHGVDQFGRDKPKSVHALALHEPGLIALHDRIAGLCRRADLSVPKRRFVPHVTLARFRNQITPAEIERTGMFLEANGTFRLDPEPIHEVELIRSTLTPAGAQYDTLASYDLR
ncbi:RNA 2',3'-cyclic phosphodiesterase [Palleronia caenipelagi]|uniref:RNA 2',3'-cyclic phosphodiesterase n=1 Tax=Palleronia caenipelagi TaxID=2489174 RepID=A0A547PR97_9RHOB|nr:RNA 2',3'-cyclic phosphodiesterase [Palleronia caenipelagi]TRD16611.1 RNA 2',3'-cyclic phosphodiesterase [Palleronia caenipelagi]